MGDFWKLELRRQQNTDLERLLVKEIRKTQFLEKSSDPMEALSFLQTNVSSCINHQDPGEQREFQMLAGQLFHQVSGIVHIKSWIIHKLYIVFLQNDEVTNYKLRSDLFDKLMQYFPKDMAQPTGG